MTQPIYVEKWVVFHVDHNGKWDVAIFSGELAPGTKCFRLKIPVPTELIGLEVIAEVTEKEERRK
jgi:hypothetical protein